MSAARQELLEMLAEKSFRLGEFQLSSGHGFLVRKAEKQHGTGQRIEGFREKGARVMIVDDVCTTGSSTVQAVEAARDFGFEIVGAMCLVERQDAHGRPNVEKAAAPAPFISIFTANEVRKQHLAVGT